MKRTLLNVMLGLILAGLVAVYWLGQRDYRHPNVQFMPDMADSIPFDTFAPNPNFANGRTLQPPPPGTVAYDAPLLPYRATTQDAARAGIELANPYASTNQLAQERGQIIYLRDCLPCHGPTGAGDGLVVKRGFPPPPALSAAHAREMQDGQLFHIVTYGQGNMPAYAAQVSLDDRWRVGLYVRQLQKNAPANPSTPPTP